MTPAQLLASNTALNGEVLRTQEALKIALLTIDKLKVELAYLRRMKYGRSSELEHAQLELVGGQVAAPAAATDTALDSDADNDKDGRHDPSNIRSLEQARMKRKERQQAGAGGLPEHLPKRVVMHMPEGHADGCACQACGCGLREIGQDISERLPAA
jgi:hypothetical protein